MRKNLIEKQIQTVPFKTESKELSERNMLKSFFVGEIRSLYWTEKYLLKALPKMQNAAFTVELKEAIEDHSSVTDDHVERLEKIFGILKEPVEVQKCETMDGLIKGTNHIIYKINQYNLTRDAGIIMALKKIQHYQIAVYDTLLHFAKVFREPVIDTILQRSLSEEKKALEVFASLTEYHLNETALLESENETEDAE